MLNPVDLAIGAAYVTGLFLLGMCMALAEKWMKGAVENED